MRDYGCPHQALQGEDAVRGCHRRESQAIPSAAFAASVAKSVAKSDAASDAGSTSAPAPKQEEESGMQDIANLFDE